jgi:hypothetical protein
MTHANHARQPSDLYHLSLDGTRLATWKAKRWHLTDQGQRLGVVTALLPDPDHDSF